MSREQGASETFEGPQRNGYVESFSDRLRDECLNETAIRFARPYPLGAAARARRLQPA
ncbi:MAG: hypothetical protein EON59_09460 [Alphaproteobacteria bacterium]|nr:MAG: hypothetical protein EON59_09460 [Alphaproteobacteria bacterium]